MFLFGGTALCVVGTSFMSGCNPWIPLTLLGPDSCRWIESSTCVWGHRKHSDSKSLCLGHTLSPVLSGTHLFMPLRAMETRSLSFSARPWSTRVSSSYYFSFTPVFITALTAAWLRETGRVGLLIGLQGDLEGFWYVSALATTRETHMDEQKWTRPNGLELALMACRGPCGSCLPAYTQTRQTEKRSKPKWSWKLQIQKFFELNSPSGSKLYHHTN